ncbi:MAG: DNA polymerase III subunit gamma and tau, partial [Cutibacterium granulosum]|nr:DNA polymerase III subunit gamma and tau [Cutibacterium granulosum]
SVQNPPLALYRRYRPDTFDEVIGQEHVTEPLKRAIVNGRVNHAYLFSGPRGCGKTTSARILARCLNCEQGPTPYPCGECQSCRDLARGGPGSIDVIEIDAASHGGVDEARDLRERAFFAPVRSRYKIYIIDEAHMVTTQGFNAMLKLVEEPPPHVKFIFATTEPEKVIGTIRSRTHHYPFRLVPPATLVNYLETLCDKEGITVDHAVLPLVVRAGGGSVRDSLSVLDQLLGGADEDGVSYELAAALLGYTPDALLDQVVDAFAAGDAHEVFATIDKVMDMGQDPRRFAEDLLRRMRDLVILAAVPDAVNNRLIDVSPEQGERLAHQAAAMGAGELTRAAEVLATGLTQMRGTTAPRLHLELMCSRILLPDADTDERGVHARLDRLERRVGIVGAGAAGSGDLVEVESSHDETAQHQRWPSGERPARPGRPASAPRGGDPALGKSSRDGGSAPATARQGSQPGARTTPSPDPTERPRRPRPGRADYRPTGAGATAPQEPQAPSQSMTGQAGSREDPRAAQSQTPAQSTTSAQSSTPEQS